MVGVDPHEANGGPKIYYFEPASNQSPLALQVKHLKHYPSGQLIQTPLGRAARILDMAVMATGRGRATIRGQLWHDNWQLSKVYTDFQRLPGATPLR